jgi:hypothetical protein
MAVGVVDPAGRAGRGTGSMFSAIYHTDRFVLLLLALFSLFQNQKKVGYEKVVKRTLRSFV